MNRDAGPQGELLVWDLPLRLFHWLLALCFAGSWLTHELGVGWFDWHRRLGYATLVLVGFRLAWGFVGTRHARFASFLPGLSGLAGELRRFASAAPVTHAGHGPLGALSTLALLGTLAFQAITGLFANDELLSHGPLYGYVSDSQSDRLTTLHKGSFRLLQLLILLHLLATAWYWLRKRSNLVRAMWTGRKPARSLPADAGITGQSPWLALAIVLLLAAALAWVLERAPPASLSLF